MKKTFNILLATFLIAVWVVSCKNEDGIQDIVPEEYHKMLYVKENGTQNVTLYNVGENVSYTFTVCKGGSDQSLTAKAKVDVIDPATDAECQDQAAQENVQYKGIPADAYTLSNTDLEYSSEETWKQVTVTVDPQKVQNAIDELSVNSGDLPVVWMLPLEVTSETDSVSSERNRYIIEIDDVLTPQIGFTKTSEQYFVIEGFDDNRTATVDFALNMEYEKWGEFTCEFEVINDYTPVDGETLLPEDSYTFSPSVTFNAQTSVKSSFTVTINDDANLESKDYVLPIRMKSISPSVEISEANSVCVLNISSAVPAKLDRTGWSAEVCCCETALTGWARPERLLINDNGGWFTTTNAANDNVYTSQDKGGHIGTFTDNSNVPTPCPHWVIIDMKKEYYVTQVSLYGLNGTQHNYLTGGEFYLNSDRDSFTDINELSPWIKIGTFDFPNENSGKFERPFKVETLAKGRFLMAYITGTTHLGGMIALDEIEVTGVSAGE